MDNDIKNRLADRVQAATVSALRAMACPACGGGLDVHFASRSTKGKGAGSLSVMCATCMWRVISDGVPSEPPWVQILGAKVRTTASAAKTAKPSVTT